MYENREKLLICLHVTHYATSLGPKSETMKRTLH